MVENLNEDQRAAIATARQQALATATEAFTQVDTDGSGFIEKNEIAQLLAKEGLGANAGEQEKEAKLKEFFETFDANNDGKVSKDEWLTFFGNFFDSVIAKSLQNS